jgi:hypothetical protein
MMQVKGGMANSSVTGAQTLPREGLICDTKYIKVVEDRPVEKEIIERIIEHHTIEKKFVVETRPAGEHELLDQRKAC